MGILIPWNLSWYRNRSLDTVSITPWQSLWMYFMEHQSITVRSQEHHGVSDHWQFDCLFNTPFRLTKKTTAKLCITGSSVDSPHKGPVMQKVFPCHDVFLVLLEKSSLNKSNEIKLKKDENGLDLNVSQNDKIQNWVTADIWLNKIKHWTKPILLVSDRCILVWQTLLSEWYFLLQMAIHHNVHIYNSITPQWKIKPGSMSVI